MAELFVSIVGSTVGLIASTLKWTTLLVVAGSGLAAVTKPTPESIHSYAKQWKKSHPSITDKVREYIAPSLYNMQDMIVCRFAEDKEHNRFIGAFGAWFKI